MKVENAVKTTGGGQVVSGGPCGTIHMPLLRAISGITAHEDHQLCGDIGKGMTIRGRMADTPASSGERAKATDSIRSLMDNGGKNNRKMREMLKNAGEDG